MRLVTGYGSSLRRAVPAMGEIIPFPEQFDQSTVARLKREGCKVKFNVTVDPDTALEILIAIGYVDARIEPGSIIIVKPEE